jgi:hypothetical protein
MTFFGLLLSSELLFLCKPTPARPQRANIKAFLGKSGECQEIEEGLLGSESSPLEAMCELGLERLEAVCSLRFFERNFWPHRFTAFLFASEGEKS